MRGQRKNPRKAVQPFENKKRKIDIFKNYEANGVEKIQRKLEIFSTLISKKSSKNYLYFSNLLAGCNYLYIFLYSNTPMALIEKSNFPNLLFRFINEKSLNF